MILGFFLFSDELQLQRFQLMLPHCTKFFSFSQKVRQKIKKMIFLTLCLTRAQAQGCIIRAQAQGYKYFFFTWHDVRYVHCSYQTSCNSVGHFVNNFATLIQTLIFHQLWLHWQMYQMHLYTEADLRPLQYQDGALCDNSYWLSNS